MSHCKKRKVAEGEEEAQLCSPCGEDTSRHFLQEDDKQLKSKQPGVASIESSSTLDAAAGQPSPQAAVGPGGAEEYLVGSSPPPPPPAEASQPADPAQPLLHTAASGTAALPPPAPPNATLATPEGTLARQELLQRGSADSTGPPPAPAAPPLPPPLPQPSLQPPPAPRATPGGVQARELQTHLREPTGPSLVFDVETTDCTRDRHEPGLMPPYTDVGPHGQYHRARIVSIAWAVLGPPPDHPTLRTGSHIVRPAYGFDSHPAALAKHRISRQRAEEEGVPLLDALAGLLAELQTCEVVVAHHVAFDLGLLRSELFRAGGEAAAAPALRPGLREACTMLAAKRMLGQERSPRLEALYAQLTGRRMVGAHGAAADVDACAVCYRALLGLQRARVQARVRAGGASSEGAGAQCATRGR